MQLLFSYQYIMLLFFFDTHHICSWILLESLTISAVDASARNFTSCILDFLKHLKVPDEHVALWGFHTFGSHDSFYFHSLHWSWYNLNNPFWLSHVIKRHLGWLDSLLSAAYTDQIKVLLCSCATWIQSLGTLYVNN